MSSDYKPGELTTKYEASGVTTKTSGKDIARTGSKVFVFIEIDSWIFATGDTKPDRRNAVVQKILMDVWRSLTTAGHPISRMTTCMTTPSNMLTHWRGWTPVVNYVFQERPSGNPEDCFETWVKAVIPTIRPVILVSVADDLAVHDTVVESVLHPGYFLASHKITYPNVDYLDDLACQVYERADPEGSVTIWEGGRKGEALMYSDD